MKKALLFALALTFLTRGTAGAEPDMLVGSMALILPINGTVYLLAEPSDASVKLCEIPVGAEVTILAEAGETYTCVNWDGQKGYVASFVLNYVVSLGGLSIRGMITDAQRENLNRFLTAFTQTRFADLSAGAFYLTDESDPLLAAFAVLRIQFDAPNEIEVGEYADGADARAPETILASIIKRFFGVAPEGLGSSDGYCYWQKSGDEIQGGAAVLTNILDMGGGKYDLYFDIVNAEAVSLGTGRAAIRASDLDDLDGFTLSSIVVSE